MRIALDAAGVAELTRRFGDLHDSVIRRFSCAWGTPGRIEVELEARGVEGAWWRLTLAVNDAREFRFAEGVAIWCNEATWEVTSLHADGTSTRETRSRDLGNLNALGATNQVIFGAAIHLAPEGVFVDLAPNDLVDPAADPDPASWRRSTFYVFGKSGEALLAPHGNNRAVGTAFLGYGAITPYHRHELFDRAVSELTAAGYRVHVIDASRADTFREQMTRVLRLKESFGYEPWTGNLDALNDAFREIDFATATGVVLAFDRFDLLHAEDPNTAHHVLDILECSSRDRLLAGNHLIGLVQSDNPALILLPVGERTPMWNAAEWLDANRGSST